MGKAQEYIKKELEQKVRERHSGKFSDCSEEFELDKFDVVDYVQECIDVFKDIDNNIIGNNWTPDEDLIIKKYYPEIGSETIKYLVNRTKSAIVQRAVYLNVKFENFWTEEEKELLKKYYPTLGTECVKYFKNRDKISIANQAHYLNIKYIGDAYNGKSKYKYVTWRKDKKRWRVELIINGKKQLFGSYIDEDEAGRVAMEKAKEYGKAI